MRGQLKIYLGYAAGVGKTYRMLDEARALREKGCDVAIGYFEPHGRKATIDKTEGIEIVPRRRIPYANTAFEEMDTDAILLRHPEVALVDELAHTNAPGSGRAKRWQDVEALRDAGIGVLTTLNVQHLESLNDEVHGITGIRVRETVPDWVVDSADEVILVDLTPRALRNRIERGVVYAPEKARQAMENFFTESNLAALREIAMRHAAHELEEKLEPAAPGPARRGERILVCVGGRPSSALLIRRARRVADYLQAGCIALHVAHGPVEETVERHLSMARNLRIETRVVDGANAAEAIARAAREEGVTQIFLGRPAPLPWWKRFEETLVQKVVREAREIQVTIVAERRR